MSLRDLFARLLAFARRDAIDADLAEEMREHLRLIEEENIANGMSSADARHAARRAFGNPTVARERSRETWGFESLDTWIADVRFGARVLRKRWPSTLVAVLALGFGIGATTAAVSVLDSVLHRRYIYDAPNRIALLWAQNIRDPSYSEGNLSPAEARLWARNATGVGISSFGFLHGAAVVARGAASRLTTAAVSVDFLPLLGVHPLLGRGFVDDDTRTDATLAAVVSYAFWQKELGGRSAAIGDTIVVDRNRCVVIGVLPPGFELPTAGEVPVLVAMRDLQWADASSREMTVVGRLSEGTTLQSVAAELAPISKRFTDPLPKERGKWTVNVESLAYFGSWTARTFTPFLALAWLVLLIACANVAILLLARMPAREHELAIRMAVGAGSRRLFRQLCMESTLIVCGGVTSGLLIAQVTSRLLAHIGSAANLQLHPRLASPTVALTTLFAATICLAFGIVPAWATLRRLRIRPVTLIGGTRSGGRADQGRLRTTLVAAEVAMSVVLLSVGALMVESMVRMQHVQLGFDAQGLVTARVTLDTLRYPNAPARRAFFTDLISRLGADGELHGVTAGTMIPLASAGWTTSLVVRPDQYSQPDSVNANTVTVMPGYFGALGFPLTAGSDFSPTGNAHSVIVNQKLAQRLWPDENPVGRRLRVLDPTEANIYAPESGERVVVGVTRNPPPAIGSAMAKRLSMIYLPYGESPSRAMSIAVHAPTVDAGAKAIRREVAALDAELPVFGVASTNDLKNEWLQTLKFSESIGEVLAAIGVALTLIGVYSVIAVLVAQRTHEIGIRLAVGATAPHVLYIVMCRTLLASLIGCIVGAIAFSTAVRIQDRSAIGELLFDTVASEIRPFVAAIALLIAVIVAAAYAAARRAATLDPLVAMRAE